METLYSVPNGPDTPLPHLSTWVLGFQVQDQHIIEEKVLPLMKGRMERMKISLKHETFYEDEPEGFTKFNLLSREKCMGLIQSVADHLLDSRIENEIVLYEFSDRPKGFPKPNLAEVLEPWKLVTVGKFRNEALPSRLPGARNLSGKLPPVTRAVTSQPEKTGAAVATQDGAGPSKPTNPDPINKELDAPLRRVRSEKAAMQLKIAGIRASLQYNGYPLDVIEDLIQNELKMREDKYRNKTKFTLKLPNGRKADSFANIDLNPYPGGKIIEKSARKCYKSETCTLPFGHTRMNCEIPASEDSDMEIDNGMHSADRRVVDQQDGGGGGGGSGGARIDDEDSNFGGPIASTEENSKQEYCPSLGFSSSEEEDGVHGGRNDLAAKPSIVDPASASRPKKHGGRVVTNDGAGHIKSDNIRQIKREPDTSLENINEKKVVENTTTAMEAAAIQSESQKPGPDTKRKRMKADPKRAQFKADLLAKIKAMTEGGSSK